MPIESRIKYDPTLSVNENAERNGVSVSAVRYFIRTRGIDRRFECKMKVIEGLQSYINEHPEATKAELQRVTGYSINTIRRYWDVLHGFETLPTNKRKEDIRGKEKKVSHKRHIAYLDKLPIEFLREYMEAREAAANSVTEATTEAVEVVVQTPVKIVEAEEITEQAPVEEVEQTPKKARTKTKQPKASRANSTILCTNEYVYFYQDTPLSNWWVSEPNIPYDGLEFTSSESLFMYLKAKVFRDDEVAVLFPKVHFDQAKELGKLVRNFNEDIWIRERKNAMYIALKAKLAVDEAYRKTLLSEEYAGKTFVEASPYDGVWGIKRSINDAYEGKEWQGLNLLGELHTIIRDELLGLREPQDVCITPIEPSEVKPTRKSKSTISKNIYPTEGEVVRSILGGIIGDIAGSSREGYSRNTASPRVLLTAQSRFTDDSAMTIALADWFNNKDKTTAKECFVKWFNKYPHAGFGKLFSKFVETGVAQPSNANGGAMRVAPCAIVAKTLDEAILLAEEQCKISHTTDVAINGAKAIAAAIFIAREETCNGKSDKETKAKIKSYIESNFGYALNMTLEEIQERSSRLEFLKAIYHTTKIESDEYLNNNMSSASLSCPMAIMAFLLGDNYEESIRYALAMGGDADSIACMAGSISAQVYGIPQQLVDEALVYLPAEMVDVLNKFESSNISPSRVTPPHITSWIPNREIVVYGSGEENNEQGIGEVTPSRFNHHPLQGYPIPTIGRSLEEIKASVATFIEYAKQNPDLRFHTRKVGYDKAGYTIEQIAPLFNGAKNVTNILLPKDMLAILNW